MSDKERLHHLVEMAGELETRLLLEMAERWVELGQREYGLLRTGTGRDWRREQREEIVDWMLYEFMEREEERAIESAELDGGG